MARYPADVWARITVHVPRGQQGIWESLRARKRCTIADIHGEVSSDRASIRDYVKRLERAGYIAAVATAGNAKVYELRRDQPEAPRLKRDGSPAKETGRGNDQMWRAMKMLGSFTHAELAVHASTEEVKVTPATARAYCEKLRRAGYLVIVRPAKNGHKRGTGQKAVYRLRPGRNTGPLAPQIQRTKYVFDPNTQEVVGLDEGGEA